MTNRFIQPPLQGMPMHEGNRFLTDPHNDSNDPATTQRLPMRKKLELKPRSAGAARTDRDRRRSTSAKGDPFANPFGAARPREEVLKERGCDVKALDSIIEKKAQTATFSLDQEKKLSVIRVQLSEAEAKFREANEKELPEESFRVEVETKRRELNEMIDQFTIVNSTAAKSKASRHSSISTKERHGYHNVVGSEDIFDRW